MKVIIIGFVLFLSVITVGLAQTASPKIYNPNADAKADIAQAVKQAKAEGKNVLLQIGGNWCPWCIRLHQFYHDQPQVDSVMKADYVFLLVNYSKENKNLDILAELGYPQRFGFPVLVILDQNGNRLHTQNTAYLEKDKSYEQKKPCRIS